MADKEGVAKTHRRILAKPRSPCEKLSLLPESVCYIESTAPISRSSQHNEVNRCSSNCGIVSCSWFRYSFC